MSRDLARLMRRAAISPVIWILAACAAAPLALYAVSLPSVNTIAATNVSQNIATLTGEISSTGGETGGSTEHGFAWGTGATLSGGDTATTTLGTYSGVGDYAEAVAVSPGQTYYFRAYATNSAGTSYGSIASFSTPSSTGPARTMRLFEGAKVKLASGKLVLNQASNSNASAYPFPSGSYPAPGVVTGAASSLTSSSATLNGTANPHGAAATGWFRYSSTDPGSCSDSFGTRVPTSSGTDLGDGSSAASYSQGVSGLTSLTTYYYCAIASNASGTSLGSVVSFTTLPTAPTGLAVSVPSAPTGMSQLNLSWTNTNATAQIRVYRGGSLVTTLSAGTTSYSDTSLSYNTAYSYTVRHYKNSLESVDSNTANGTTLDHLKVTWSGGTIDLSAGNTVSITSPGSYSFSFNRSGTVRVKGVAGGGGGGGGGGGVGFDLTNAGGGGGGGAGNISGTTVSVDTGSWSGAVGSGGSGGPGAASAAATNPANSGTAGGATYFAKGASYYVYLGGGGAGLASTGSGGNGGGAGGTVSAGGGGSGGAGANAGSNGGGAVPGLTGGSSSNGGGGGGSGGRNNNDAGGAGGSGASQAGGAGGAGSACPTPAQGGTSASGTGGQANCTGGGGGGAGGALLAGGYRGGGGGGGGAAEYSSGQHQSGGAGGAGAMTIESGE